MAKKGAKKPRTKRPALSGDATPPPRVHHVHALSPERDHLEIKFPRVESYAVRIEGKVDVAWDRVPVLTLDPLEIPDAVKVKGLSTEQGSRLSLLGPGRTDQVTLQEWRATKRLQELEFELARELTARYARSETCAIPSQTLFPQMLGAVRRFLAERVQPVGGRDKRDVFLEPYFSWAVEMLAEAIVPEDDGRSEIPRYEAHRGPGSTRDVDFWTSKSVRETECSHLNLVVADTAQWEQSAAFYLEIDPHVIAYVKNFNLGFAIPYEHNGVAREYLPDFLVRVQKDGREVGMLILETKGYDPLKHVKIGAAHRWVHAVNAEGSFGHWAFRILSSPAIAPAALDSAADELANPTHTDWRAALRDFMAAVREHYGARLDRVLLYGSRARGDAEWDSDVDVLVVLDRCDDFWAEMDRVSGAAADIMVKHGVVLSAMPASIRELETSDKPIFSSIRREGVHA